MLAAPAVPRDTLQAALMDLHAASIAPLLERLSYHRIDGLAYRAVARLPRRAVDPWLRASLKRRHERLAAGTLVQGMAMAELLQGLATGGIRVAVLGGLRIVESIYGDAGSRPIETHDLLVRPADREAAAATLRRLGLQPAGSDRFRRGALLVDLHVDPLGVRRRKRGKVLPLSSERLIERATSGRVAGAPAMLLSGEDELHLLALDTVRRSFDRLIGVADLAYLVAAQGHALDWGALRARALASGTSRLLGLALKSTTLLGVSPHCDSAPGASAGWLERLLMRRAGSLRPFPLGGEILLALSAPGFTGGLHRLIDALFPMSRPGVGAWRPPSTAARRSVVAFHPRAATNRHQEESLHGR